MGHGMEMPATGQRRHGVSPSLTAPDEPRQGWSRWSEAVRARRLQDIEGLASVWGIRNPCGAGTGVQDGDQDGHGQQGEGQQQGRPLEAEERETRQGRDDDVPLGHHGERPEQGRGRLVDGLKERAAPGPLVDPPSEGAQELLETFEIELSRPGNMPRRRCTSRAFLFEVGFGLAVVQLLPSSRPLTEFRLWCHTMAAGLNPRVPPLPWRRQHRSTSSPAMRNL